MRKQKSDKHYKIIYRLFYPIFRIVSFFKFGIKGVKPKKYNEPVLILCNHTTDMDFLCVTSYIKNHMYFVCSQHVLGMGLTGKMLKAWFNPIAVYKGAKKQKEVMDILRRIKKGNNVLIFPEGKISHNGFSSKLDESIGKLAKMAKCKIVTFRTEGGFFKQPRWQNYANKGRLFSHGIVGEYDIQTIQDLSVEQITEIINRDLFVDAYALQEKYNYSYKLKKGVKDVTRYYSVCPNCNKYGELISNKDEIKCSCGYELSLDDKFNLVEGKIKTNNPIKTFKQWNELQQKIFRQMFDNRQTLIEKDVALFELGEAHQSRRICVDTLQATCTALEIGSFIFTFDKMEGLEVLSGGSSLVFAFDGAHYELKCEKSSLVGMLEYYNFAIS